MIILNMHREKGSTKALKFHLPQQLCNEILRSHASQKNPKHRNQIKAELPWLKRWLLEVWLTLPRPQVLPSPQ